MSTGSLSNVTPHDAADLLKARLREDLRASMRAKDTRRVRVLRVIIAALDNAQAVPPGDQHTRYEVRSFGDRSAEVPRLRIDPDELRQILQQEIAARIEAANELEKLGKPDRAAELRFEAAVIGEWI